MYRRFFKRFFDFCSAIIALILLLPVALIVFIILAVSNRGTPFFSQVRPGRNGNLFRIHKFKTMNDKKDTQGQLLPHEQRVTKTGTLIRKLSLDEIPQLWNVIKGDMSIIGPRPLLEQYLPLYSKEQQQRHDVRPGITGWAQVNGRNAISWKQKFEYDVWYVRNMSFALDLKIIMKTIQKVLVSEGVNKEGNLSMPVWKGGLHE